MMMLALAAMWQTMLGMGLVLLASIAFARILGSAGFPSSGRAVVAGAIAGVLIGPMVLGRVVPDAFDSMFVGGIDERKALSNAQALHAAAPLALPVEQEERVARQLHARTEIAATEQALQDARWQHQRPLRIFTMIVVAVAMLMSATQSVRDGDRRQGWITPASIGFWAFALPAALAYMIAMRWWDTSIGEAAMLAAVVGIGPWALGAIDRRVADDAEFGGARMLQTAGRIASTLALALALWASWRLRGPEGVLIAATMLTLPLAWFCDVLPRNPTRLAHVDNFTTPAIELVLAIIATLVTIRIDLSTDFAIWPLIVLALLADDGRWLGAFLGAMLPGGRPALRSMRLVMPAMTAGPTQISIAALALWGGLIAERFALPLLAGAILIETTAPARRRMAEHLIETEEDIDANSPESRE